MHTVYDRMYGDFSAYNTVYTPYIHICVWFWPTLLICHLALAVLSSLSDGTRNFCSDLSSPAMVEDFKAATW